MTGPGSTHDPWICSQTHICSQTRYRLCYVARPVQMSEFMFGEVIRVSECVNANKAHLWNLRSKSYFAIKIHGRPASDQWSFSILTLTKLSNFFMLLLPSAKLTFSKNSFRNKIRVSNPLDPDQDQHSVGPDLDPNCLHLGYQQMTKVAAVK